jgi:hypothetical protein
MEDNLDWSVDCIYHLLLMNEEHEDLKCFSLLPPYSGARSHTGAQDWLLSFLIFSKAGGPLGRVISSSQGLYLNTGQHKHRKRGHALNIHAQGGIRTRNHGLRAIEDCSWLRQLGYRDRQI